MRFNKEIYKRGYNYYNRNAIKDVTSTKFGYKANVQGEQLYHVEAFVADDKIIHMTCTCPYSQKGYLCKHEAALFIHLQSNNKETKKPEKMTVAESFISDNSNTHFYSQSKVNSFLKQLSIHMDQEVNTQQIDSNIFSRWNSYLSKTENILMNQRYHVIPSDWKYMFLNKIYHLITNIEYLKLYEDFLVEEINEKSNFSLFNEYIKILNEKNYCSFILKCVLSINNEKHIDQLLESLFIQASKISYDDLQYYFEQTNQYADRQIYQYYWIKLSQNPEEAKEAYKKYKDRFKENYELEAYLFKDEKSLNIYSQDVQKDLINSCNIESLKKLKELYDSKWDLYCFTFYNELSNLITKSKLYDCVFQANDWKYAAYSLLTMNNQSYVKYVYSDFQSLVEDYDEEIAKYIYFKTLKMQLHTKRTSFYSDTTRDLLNEAYEFFGDKNVFNELLYYLKETGDFDQSTNKTINLFIDDFMIGA